MAIQGAEMVNTSDDGTFRIACVYPDGSMPWGQEKPWSLVIITLFSAAIITALIM